MLSKFRQQSEQQRYDEARPRIRMPSTSLGPYLQCSEPCHQCVTPFPQQVRCTECRRPMNDQQMQPCNNITGQSYSEKLFQHQVIPSAQHWCHIRCTEFSKPSNIQERLWCNSEPGQSWGPHLKCSEEEPFHHHAIQNDHLGYRVTCTQCCRSRSLPDMLPCDSVPGESRGPHLQCTEQHSIHCCTAAYW